MTTKEQPPFANLLAETLSGILVPFPTPFDTAGEVDRRAITANIEKWNTTGVKGYVVLGSTGERVHLSDREAMTVIETARAAVPETHAFIVGAGQQSTRATLEEVRRLADAGADAVLLISPNYYRAEMTPAALADYYRAVADSSTLPALLYNVPQLTGIALAPETVAQLSEHENIIGIKDSSGDILNLSETLRLVPESFIVLTGHGAALATALYAGAHGAILAVACFATRACVEIYDAFNEGQNERALDLQRRVAHLVRALMGRFGIGGIKTAMEFVGYTGGRVRSPLRMPDEGARQEIARLLYESGLFDDEMTSAYAGQQLGAGAK